MRAFMKRERTSIVALVAIVLCAGIVAGCGSTGNNDHGVAYTLTDIYNNAREKKPLAALIMPLSDAGSSENVAAEGGAVWVAPAVRNNLEGGANADVSNETGGGSVNPYLRAPFIQGERAYPSYYIPGAQVQPPSTSTPYGGIATGYGGASWADTIIVTPDVRSWLIMNKDLLPEPPFVMTVTIEIQGTSSAGDTYFTNPMDFPIEVVPDIVVQGGAGASNLGEAEDEEGELEDVALE
jgi:hypothetical protein